jgi:transmembrane sensor
MDKNELQALAQKYLEGTATPQEKALLNEWYDVVQTGTPEIVNLQRDETEVDVKQRMYNNLNQQLFTPQKQQNITGTIIKRLSIWVGSAAAVLALTFFAWSWYVNHKTLAPQSDGQIVNVPYNRVMHLTLPDSSRVWLNAGSVFRYPKKFIGKTRTVELLEGRAFFDVKHQTQHPFIVKTKNLNITVLGTSFDVRSYQKEGTTQVRVVTGKVGITVPNGIHKDAIMLLPKQQIILSNVSSHLVTEVAHDAKVSEWTKNNFVFEQESLGNVFKALEKEYNTQISVENKKLLDERITIKLNNQHLDTIMEILSYTKHFKYQMANDSTVIVK